MPISLVKNRSLKDVYEKSDGGIIGVNDGNQYFGINIEPEYNEDKKQLDCKNIVPIVDYKYHRRSVIYASGMSGSGKSSFALSVISASAQMLNKVSDLKQRFIIVTRENIDDDQNYYKSYYGLPSISELAKKKVLDVINYSIQELIDADILNTFLPSCSGYITYILLDDMDSLTDDKEYYKQFEHLLLTRARKFRCHVFICNHRAADMQNTKHILTELTGVWIPTKSKVSLNFKTMLEKHCDLQKIKDKSISNFISFVKDKTRFIYCSLDNSFGIRYFVLNNVIFEE